MIKALLQKLGLDRIDDVLVEEARRIQVEVLREDREVLARMIAKLDERIHALGGKRQGRPQKVASAVAAQPVQARRPRPRRRIVHQPGETLRDMVVRALAKASAPVKVGVLVDLVKELGYRTTAKRSTLRTSIYHVLADEKLFRRFGPGVYGLVAASAAPPKARKPRGRKKAAARKAPRTAAKEQQAEAAEPAEVKAE